MVPSWRTCYYYPALKTFVTVYVDNFTMFGPESNHETAWRLIQLPSKPLPPSILTPRQVFWVFVQVFRGLGGPLGMPHQRRWIRVVFISSGTICAIYIVSRVLGDLLRFAAICCDLLRFWVTSCGFRKIDDEN